MSSISSFAQNNFNPNEVIVMVHHDASIAPILSRINTTFPEVSLSKSRTLSERTAIFLLAFDSTTSSVNEVMSYLKQDERVLMAQPNHNNVQSRNTIPNDLDYPVQWSLRTTVTANIFAPQAWDITTDGLTQLGDTIVMAVVDGGVDIEHIDLNMFKNKHEIPNNNIDDDNNGYVDDYDGWNAYSQSGNITSDPHGTHIAGIAGAKTNNAEGIAGIVWGGKIMPINASSNLESIVIEGYGYALEMRTKYNESNGDSGAFIVATNSSFGLDREKPIDFPIWCAFYDTLGAAGILNLTATTNSGYDVDAVGDIPTTCPSEYMVAVSNVNQNGNISGGYGATQIDLAAPGTDIYSTLPGHNYGYNTGTSMATPEVMGVVGAMYSAMCGFDFNEVYAKPDSITLWVKNALLESVDTVSNLNGKNKTSGRLNMFKSVKSVQIANLNNTYFKQFPTNNNTDGSIISQVTGGTRNYSYLWNTGSTDSALVNVGSGSYNVIITEHFGCTLKDSTDLWTLGLSNLSDNSDLVVYPNPSNGTISIQSQNEAITTVKILDNLGRVVLIKQFETSSNSELSLPTNLAPGMYILVVNDYTPTTIVIQ
jgi:hypothetical protein